MKFKYLLWISLLLISSYLIFVFANVDSNIGRYIFKDNGSIDRYGNTIAAGELINTHGYILRLIQAGTTDDADYVDLADGKRAVRVVGQSGKEKVYLANWTNSSAEYKNATFTVLWSGSGAQDGGPGMANSSSNQRNYLIMGAASMTWNPNSGWTTCSSPAVSLATTTNTVWNVTFYTNRTMLGCSINGTVCTGNCTHPDTLLDAVYLDVQQATTGYFADLKVFNGTTLPEAQVVVPDTTPPSITLINLTSDGLNEIIFAPYSGIDNRFTNILNTTDSTPTLRVNTSESSTCNLIDNRTRTVTLCATTGALLHTCTQSAILPIGVSNQSFNCSDASNNINITEFMINITDGIPPNITMIHPLQNMLFKEGVNNTIYFNFSSIDNYDRNFTATIYIRGTQEYTNSTYLNGTNVQFQKTVSVGAYYWNVTVTDSFNNINSSAFNFSVIGISMNFSLNLPRNNTLNYTSGLTQFNATINFSETINKCFLFINNKENQSNTSGITTNIHYMFNATLTNGDYNWSVGCNTTDNSQKNSTIFSYYVNAMPTVIFSVPTPANNSLNTSDYILINVTTTGRIKNYTLDWNGTNQSVDFNTTLNLLINKTGLNDLTTYRYRVYVNDTNGNQNNTEDRYIRVNFIGLTVAISSGTNFTFKPDVYNPTALFPNQSLAWQGNNTAIALVQRNLINLSVVLYNNGTKINVGSNYTINPTTGRITIFNSTTLFNGSTTEWITNKLNLSYEYYTGNFTVRLQNISCQGQNESIGCINASNFGGNNLNFSLLFNITSDPPNQRIIEDFSTTAKNWTVFQQRSNNTINRTLVNSSVACAEIQSINSIGLIEYRFNNTIPAIFLNSTNSSIPINLTFDCIKINYFTRILNGTQKNISGFDSFNFSWKGDNTTNQFNITLIDDEGTKVSSKALSLANTNFNYSGIALGTLKNISKINISVSNFSGADGLSGFFIDNLKITNTTSNQSNRVRMKANCVSNYANSTLLIPNVWTNLCSIASAINQYIWLYQDINLTQKGISWKLQYNASTFT